MTHEIFALRDILFLAPKAHNTKNFVRYQLVRRKSRSQAFPNFGPEYPTLALQSPSTVGRDAGFHSLELVHLRPLRSSQPARLPLAHSARVK
jgi:hypothetical protein